MTRIPTIVNSKLKTVNSMWEKIKAFFTTEKYYIEKRIPQLIKGGSHFELSKAGAISTVHTCIKILGETLSKLPLEVYKSDESIGKTKDKENYLYELLHYNPNQYTTSQSFINALETVRNFKGNAFALIHRENNGRINNFEILDTDRVAGYIIKGGNLYYSVVKPGIKYPQSEADFVAVSCMDILHFKMMTKDGIWGVNPIEALRLNLSSTYKGLETIDTFYDNNAASPKAIKSTVSGANQDKMIEAIKKFNAEYAGSTNAGKMIPLPPNTEIQELKLNFADAEFIQTIKFNAGQIAALYGVQPHRVGNTEASKYNNVEQMDIGFKGDTMSPIARMYRQEFEFKCLTTEQRRSGTSIEFNLRAMIETDHKTRLEGYRTLSQIGAISANEIAQIENLKTVPNGDARMVPMNMMSIDKLTIQDNNGKSKSN